MYKKSIFKKLALKYDTHMYSGINGILMKYCHKNLEYFKGKDHYSKVLEIGPGSGNLTNEIIAMNPKKLIDDILNLIEDSSKPIIEEPCSEGHKTSSSYPLTFINKFLEANVKSPAASA